MKKLFMLLIITCIVMTACSSNNTVQEETTTIVETSDAELELSGLIVGKWVTVSGTAENTVRIYNFYESGLLDTYIGDDSSEPMIGSYKVEDEKIYMNNTSRSEPEKGVEFTVDSYDKNEIILSAKGKTITWKRYQ